MMHILKNDLGTPNSVLLKADHTEENTEFRINPSVVIYFLLIIDFNPLAIMFVIPLFPSVGFLYLVRAKRTPFPL